MTTRAQQWMANGLILAGVTPFLLWIVLLLHIRRGGVGLSDAIFVLALGLLAYLISLGIAVPAMFWVRAIRKRSRLRTSLFDRGPCIIGISVLLFPWAYLAGQYFASRIFTV